MPIKRAGAGSKRSPKNPKRELGSEAEWAMVRLTKWIIGVTVFTGLLAVFATGFAGLQWWEAHSGSKTAEKQATASVELARAAKQQAAVAATQTGISSRLAKASNEQAESARKGIAIAQQQASVAFKQLAQNRDLWSVEHQPILDYDPASPNSATPVAHAGEIRWNYGFKNFGTGPAHNVIFDEEVSINGGPFQKRRVIGSKFDVPGTGHWSTARYFFRPGERSPPPDGYFQVYPAKLYPTLRVTFRYSDTLGKAYENVFCFTLAENGSRADCTYNPGTSTHGRKRPLGRE